MIGDYPTVNWIEYKFGFEEVSRIGGMQKRSEEAKSHSYTDVELGAVVVWKYLICTPGNLQLSYNRFIGITLAVSHRPMPEARVLVPVPRLEQLHPYRCRPNSRFRDLRIFSGKVSRNGESDGTLR